MCRNHTEFAQKIRKYFSMCAFPQILPLRVQMRGSIFWNREVVFKIQKIWKILGCVFRITIRVQFSACSLKHLQEYNQKLLCGMNPFQYLSAQERGHQVVISTRKFLKLTEISFNFKENYDIRNGLPEAAHKMVFHKREVIDNAQPASFLFFHYLRKTIQQLAEKMFLLEN